MKRTSRAVVALALTLSLLAGATTASAHGNHLSADSQVSGDGSVMVERLFVDQAAYLVLHADNDGNPGKVIGHKAVSRGFHAPISVEMSDEFWNDMAGNETVWAVLHEDNGDGEFNPKSDGELQAFGGAAATPITVRKGAGSVSVAAAGFSVKETQVNNVTIPQVTTSQSSFLVLRTNTNGAPGEIVGHAPLAAGTETNVPVIINETYFDAQQAQFLLWATVYEDNGDGEFDPATDKLVTAGGVPVASLFTVAKPLGDNSGDGGLVNTPSQTATQTTTDAEPTQTPTTTEGPGFGVLAALVALSGFVCIRLGRRV
ncbi:PGF-CTERM sorting domain-containing protein [Haladaptatus sp. DJG-WS-42]|uniref:DUF7282 domain-containing protein n=1 Tax=Haladaptatus sp. DJG-WS-42 TaxID=3120516 RepID=UPI0030CB0F8A